MSIGNQTLNPTPAVREGIDFQSICKFLFMIADSHLTLIQHLLVKMNLVSLYQLIN